MAIEFSRVWQMPNKNTFSIPAIGKFVKKYLKESDCSVDPFARNNQWSTHTNDLDTTTKAKYHMECEDFLKSLIEKKVRADLIILDPPYSPRQIKECYNSIGLKMGQKDAQTAAHKKRRKTRFYSSF